MKNLFTLSALLLIVLTFTACSKSKTEIESSIKIVGLSNINVNEKQIYKVIYEDDTSIEADSYVWSVTNKETNVTADDTTSQSIELSALSAGSFTLNVKVTKKTKSFTTELQITASALEIINGHTLPPMPDKTLNDSTLLGIDSNDNGVRDDVEIWIYKTYKKPIEHAVMMQNARAYQIVIVEPEKAVENLHYILDVSDCESFWKIKAKGEGEFSWLEEYREYSKELREVQFNTATRYLSKKSFNSNISGSVFSSSEPKKWKNRCDFNTSKLEEK